MIAVRFAHSPKGAREAAPRAVRMPRRAVRMAPQEGACYSEFAKYALTN